MKVTMKSRRIYKQKGGEKKMKHIRIITAFGIAAFGLATLAFMTSTWAVENIRETKHNLTLATNNVKTGDTTEVCVFCHTPHGSNTDASGAPLWNRKVNTGSYNMYTGPNIDGVIAGTPQGSSLACLSCHDGTIAFDQLYNLPGSGGNNAGASTSTITFNNVANLVSSEMFDTAAAPFPRLGTDLTNDHPISIKICAADGLTRYDEQFAEACTNQTASTGSVLKIKRTAGVYPTSLRDTIRAYKNTGATDFTVECASCHNPHINSSRFLRYQSALPSNDAFVTAVAYPTEDSEGSGVDRNKGSLLCLSCHQK